MFRKDKIYKIVYETNYRSDGQRTLLVVAKDPVRGLNEFYKRVGDVRNILEFTEIKSREEKVKISEQ